MVLKGFRGAATVIGTVDGGRCLCSSNLKVYVHDLLLLISYVFHLLLCQFMVNKDSS